MNALPENELDAAETGHTPLWPAYTAHGPNAPRVLALYLASGEVITELGERWRPADFATLADWLYSGEALLFCEGALEATLPAAWLGAALTEDRAGRERRPARQWCELRLAPASEAAVSITIHRTHNRRQAQRHICSGVAWAPRLNLAGLRELRELFTVLGTGPCVSPAATGLRRMLMEWGNHPGWVRHHRPALGCIDALSRYAVGGRIESYAPDEIFNRAWELDKTAAYASAVCRVPSGTACYMPSAALDVWPTDRPAVPSFTWFARAMIAITRDLPPGHILPFAVRDAASGDLSWPTRRGVYETWVWSGEARAIEAARQAGMSVELTALAEGWRWPTCSTQLGEWATAMDGARRRCDMPSVASLIKRCTVAAIGRLGMGYESCALVSEDEANETDHMWCSPVLGLVTRWYVRRAFSDLGTPLHWQRHTVMATNLDLYQHASRAIDAGRRVLAMNIDSYTLDAAPVVGTYLRASRARMGDYKLTRYLDYWSAPKPGYMLARRKVRLPGIPAHERARYLRTEETVERGVEQWAKMQDIQRLRALHDRIRRAG